MASDSNLNIRSSGSSPQAQISVENQHVTSPSHDISVELFSENAFSMPEEEISNFGMSGHQANIPRLSLNESISNKMFSIPEDLFKGIKNSFLLNKEINVLEIIEDYSKIPDEQSADLIHELEDGTLVMSQETGDYLVENSITNIPVIDRNTNEIVDHFNLNNRSFVVLSNEQMKEIHFKLSAVFSREVSQKNRHEFKPDKNRDREVKVSWINSKTSHVNIPAGLNQLSIRVRNFSKSQIRRWVIGSFIWVKRYERARSKQRMIKTMQNLTELRLLHMVRTQKESWTPKTRS